jgi:hypothetical protein
MRIPAHNVLAAVIVSLLATSICVSSFAGSGLGAKIGSRSSHTQVPNSAMRAPQISAQGIDVFRAYSTEPAPMGIADYGVGPSGFYQYSTNAFLASVSIVSLQTRNATGDPSMGFQLNVVLDFADITGEYAYWVQDVAQIDTSTNQIFFFNNIWNFTAPRANMNGSAVAGNGQVSVYKGTGYYYDAPSTGIGNGINLVYPATDSFLVTTSLNSAREPTVAFQYEDGSGFQTYDNVTFKTANRVSTFSGFEVNGNSYNPAGTFFDSEMVLAGPGGGLSTADVKSDLRMSLYYWNGHNYQAVSNTYNFGSNTAETLSNAVSLGNYVTATGSLIALVQAGAGSLGKSYTQGGTGTISIQTPVTSGILYVSNSTYPNPTPFQTAFTGSQVTVSLHPGDYLLQIYVNGAVYDSGTVAVGPGQTLQLRTPLGDIQITMSFFVSGGSTGFVAPMLSYVHGGSPQKTDLTSMATIYYMDPGTSWTVTANSTTATERWQTTQLISGTASSFQTVQFTYYHQYHVSFDFAVNGGGTGYSSPSVRFAQFGTQKTVATKSPVWADAGSNYSYPNSLVESSASERWEAQSFAGLVGAAGTIEATYFHQYGLMVSYVITGGGSPPSPALVAKQFAQNFMAALGPSPNSYFLDAGSVWTISNSIQGNSANERWETDVPTNGSLTSALTVALNFHHQYMVITGLGPASGGSIANLTGWQDQGAPLQLSATPNLGWKFEGWNGTGIGSYTGRSSTTLVTVGSPIQENATFYPGLSIVAGNNGQMSYSFGSTSGTVQAGTTATVFVPVGTVVAIGASPASFLYSFSGWSKGSGGTGSATSLTLASPATIQASFSVNILVVGGIAGVVLVVVLVSAYVMRSRRPPTKWDQVSNPKNNSP